tara:strand:+ start:1121 stop:1642 length:522 start_codon:yes stop_codon:yes gene_type:complete
MKQLDNTTFDRPIPGMSMTHELGARPWQTPPTYATVEEAADYYIERMANPDFRDQLLDIMEMKIPLTTLANTIQLGSVMEGIHTVDVGMLMIPILVETMMLIGDNADADYVTGMEGGKPARPAMIDKIINNVKSKQMESEDMPIEETMEEPIQEQEEDMPMEEEPKGLMARRG